MRKKRLLWLIFPSFLIVALGALGVVSLYAGRLIEEVYADEIKSDTHTTALVMAEQCSDLVLSKKYDQLDRWAKKAGKRLSLRITVILPDGTVVADSEKNPQDMDNHSDRVEVRNVLEGKDGASKRFSFTLGKEMLYVAVPLVSKETGVMRIAIPLQTISGSLHTVYQKLAWAGVITALFTALVSLFLSRWLSKPLEDMKSGADRFARGDLAWRMEVPNTYEMASLAESLNSMANQLGDRIRILIEQRNEEQAVLSSMVEGVLAIDMDERVISINSAGANLLEINPDQVHGRSIQEAVRNTDLQNFVKKALTSKEPVEGDIVLCDNGGRFLQAHGTILHDASGNGVGAVIVLNDVTRLQRLETIRKDFVANVSHELKTPITSIKGFVDTLLDGALQNPEDALRFLQIIQRQTDRLNAIIEDILILSRMEQSSENNRIDLEKQNLSHVLSSAVQLCELKAKDKDINVLMECDSSLHVPMNAHLLEQAVVNLLDNAIKYSDSGKTVRIIGKCTSAEAAIDVVDEGAGIESEHLPRLFERFYRIDKARSRKLGGTGLGLSIVKHIVLAHGGTITVQSSAGKGSTFTIHLPLDG